MCFNINFLKAEGCHAAHALNCDFVPLKLARMKDRPIILCVFAREALAFRAHLVYNSRCPMKCEI